MNTTRDRVNWEAVKRRLADDAEKLERCGVTTLEQRRSIWRQRAEQLACRVRDEHGSSGRTRPMLIFSVADQTFAVDVAAVAGVRATAKRVTIPSRSASSVSLMAVHGEIWSLRDAASMLNVPHDPTSTNIVLLRPTDHRQGLLVDRIERIDLIDIDQLAPIPATDRTSELRTLGITDNGVVVIDHQELLNLTA